jgi:hypothetical protein
MSDVYAGMSDAFGATLNMGALLTPESHITGRYSFQCIDPDGATKWTAETDNIVVLVGRNAALDYILATAAQTPVGPFMGLISGSTVTPTFSSVDTMASHTGWVEAGSGSTNYAPTYTAPRKSAAFSAASSGQKALSAALSFAITSSGIVSGAFLVYGTGAVSTIQDTNGVLFSEGFFTGSSRSVSNGDTLNVSYSCSLSTV